MKTTTKKPAIKRAKRKNSQTRFKDSDLKSIDANGLIRDENSAAVWQSEQKAIADIQTLKGLFFSEDWVFITVDKIAESISNLEMKVYHRTVKDNELTFREAANHPVQKLLDQPNEKQDKHSFLYSLLIDDTLVGNSFIWYAKAINQLIQLPAENIQYQFDQDYMPKSLLYVTNFYENEFLIDTRFTNFHLDDVIHTRRPNPSSQLWGLSPFVPGRRSVLFNRYSMENLLMFYSNGANPHMVLKLDKVADDRQAKRMLRSFETAYVGRPNQRRTMLLPKGMDVEAFDQKIADQELPELVKQNRETILNLLKIPKHAVGLQESGSLGSQEHYQALKFFWNSTLAPIMRRIAGEFTRAMKQELGDDYCIQFDTSEVSFLQDDRDQLAEYAGKIKEIATVNERRKIIGLEPLPDHDFIAPLRPQQTPMPQLRAARQVDSHVVSSERNDSESKEYSAENTEQRTQDDDEPDPQNVKAKQAFLARKGKQVDENLKDQAELEAKIFPEQFDLGSRAIINQIRVVVAELKKNKSKSIDDDKRNEIENDLDDIDPGPVNPLRVDIDAFETAITEQFEQQEEDFANQYQELQFSASELGYNSQLNLVFNEQNRSALEASKLRSEDNRRKSLRLRGIDAFKQMSKTTTENVMKIVEKGIRDQLTIDEVARQILDKAKRTTPARAQTIARTETLTAVSLGSQAMIEDSKEVFDGKVRKMWLSARDERVRETHRVLDGQRQDADDPFLVRGSELKFPRDPSGPAKETINCRCTQLVVTPEDEDVFDDIGSRRPRENPDE